MTRPNAPSDDGEGSPGYKETTSQSESERRCKTEQDCIDQPWCRILGQCRRQQPWTLQHRCQGVRAARECSNADVIETLSPQSETLRGDTAKDDVSIPRDLADDLLAYGMVHTCNGVVYRKPHMERLRELDALLRSNGGCTEKDEKEWDRLHRLLT